MNHRSREIDTLFQRLATAQSASRDPAVENDAASAVREWPLFALLTPAETVAAAPVRHMQMAVEAPRPPTAPRAVEEAVPEPVAGHAAEAIPEPELDEPSRQLSPLEQLFLRAERTGKPQSAPPSVFQPAAPLPSLKAPVPPMERARAPQLTPPRAPAPVADEIAVMIEPRPHSWRETEAAPERLFERVGGC